MHRHLRTAGLIWMAVAVPLDAQTYLELLRKPILGEDERRSMMYSFVDRNLPAIELPASRAAWEALRPRLKSEILRLVGLEAVDRRGPVKWESKGKLDRDGYTIEKILYESYPGMMVPAVVFTPKGLAGRAPAMVNIPGHEYCDGKSGLTVQARSVNLVRRGLIVISYDYIGTFERNSGENPCSGMPYGGGNDHGLRGFSYTGGNPTGLEILDGIRAIDYLWSRSDVDRNRIGFTGESGGSNSTYWVSALDDRVKLAVPVASVTTFDYWIRNNRNWDWHQRPAGIRRVAEISTLLALVAPRPLLVIGSLAGTDSEEFPFEETTKSVTAAKKVYELYGKGTDIGLWESRTSHGYQADKRERMYGWVERHFFGKKADVSEESPFQVEPRENLRCGLPAGNKTLRDIYGEWLERPAKTTGDVRGGLRELLGVRKLDFQPVLGVQTTTSRSDAVIRQLIFETEPGIHLPAVEWTPRNSGVDGTVIVLGRGADVADAVDPLLSRKLRAVFFDVRGTGETSPGGGRTDNWAWFAGRPWPGMWLQDLQAIITALTGNSKNSRIGVIGTGAPGKAALFAAALDTRIGAVLARLPSLSYREEARRGLLADVPGILTVADLPEVAALVAPRGCRLELAGPAGATDWGEVAEWFAERLRRNGDGRN